MNAETILPAGADLRWVESSIGASVVRMAPLVATSSTVVMLQDDRERRYVVRWFTSEQWLCEEPDLAEHEAGALQMAETVDVPTPELIAYDAAGHAAGVPAVVMTHLPGMVVAPQPPEPAWLRTLAGVPVAVAAADTAALRWPYDPWIADDLELPRRDRGLWQRAAAVVAPGLPDAPMVVLHRDHHPMNLLFSESRLSGVVDWVNACVGPAPVDIAHCRVNLTAMYGVATANRVRDHWCSLAGHDYDPRWDLVTLLGTLPIEPYPPWLHVGLDVHPAVMERRLQEMLRHALSELGE